MLRRSHRKSRGGCFECKRRHVKCDEHRPTCRLCANSDRTCHYPVQVPDSRNLKDASSSTTPSAQEYIIDFAHHGSSTDSLRSTTTIHSPNTTTTDSASTTDDTSSEFLNLTHLSLLIHLTNSPSMFNLGASVSPSHSTDLALGLNIALSHPYLMHELLAFSALHLAHLHPSQSGHYLDMSVRLQTRAIELFNKSYNDEGGVRKENCVAIVLFSSILGCHVLASTLQFRHPSNSHSPFPPNSTETGNEKEGDFDHVLAQYIQCMDTHRGIHTIATSSWPALMASPLAAILEESRDFTSREPVGKDCDMLRRRVKKSTEMTEQEKEACMQAIGYLQVGFDATTNTSNRNGHENGNRNGDREINRHHMIYTWTMLVPREVTGLLVRKQPEAVALLAHYAVLLHRGRELWQVGDAGVYLFRLVEKHLELGWDEVMEGLRREILGN